MAYPSVSYTFTNGTVADGANVSTNFSNLVSGLSDGTKDLNMNAATFAGNLTANGNIVLGNATSDTVILTGIVSLATAGSYISNLLGSALLPSYSFTGDVNTGIWSSGADTLNFSLAGAEKLRIDSTGVIVFGTGDTTRFTVYGDTTPEFQGFGFGGSYASPTASALGQSLVLISGRGYGTGFTGTKGSMAINAEALWTATSNPTYITFTTTPAASVTPVERMRIDSSGNIAIATTVATNVTAGRTYLSIKGTSAAQPGVLQLINFTGDGTGQNLGNIEWVNPDNTSSSSLRSASIAAITYGSTANNRGSYIIFATKADGVSGGGTERMQIDSSGQVGIGLTPTARNNCNLQLLNGIGFPATQVASSDVNTLDDYEEGTWTPTLGGDATYGANHAGYYTKIGNLVTIRARIYVNVLGTGATNTCAGLPFTSNASVVMNSALSIGYFSGLVTNIVSLYASIPQNGTTIYFYSATSAQGTLGASNVFQNGALIDISGSYTV